MQIREFLSKDLTVRGISLVIVLSAWEVYGRSVNPILFTYPTAIVRAFVELAQKGELWRYGLQSLQVLVYGVLMGVLVAVPMGVLTARFRVIDKATDIYVNALYATPMVAIVPLLVLWFGFGIQAKTIVVFLFTVFPLLINTYQGVKNVDKNLLEVARSFCSSERQLWFDVILPSALPFIIAGFRLAVGRALVGMVLAEFYTSIAGLGYLIVRYSNTFQTAKLFVPIVVLMALGVASMELLKWVERKLAPWNRAIEEK
ncbi:MAG: ABC transporter permease [Firmicutes bacterium]|nr:ABC transporter permease [Bacillota bacterium]